MHKSNCRSRSSVIVARHQPQRVTDRRWEKLAGTCDYELVQLFHDERRKLRLSVSQMLDYVLWNFFDKPRLSFQSKRSEKTEDQEEQP